MDEPTRIPHSPAAWIATGMGLGLVAPAPGTIGTAVWGIPLAWAVSQIPNVGWQLAVIVLLNALGIPVATAAGRALGGKKDNQAIVCDEIGSFPIVFLAVPFNWKTALAGFLLHRFMDILKPPPARQLEHLPEGLGVMADDWMAAIYAGAALSLLVWLTQHTGWDVF
jgi:phosphatidylglycerophosphatase A